MHVYNLVPRAIAPVAPHVHIWGISRVVVEASRATGVWTRVAYLLCQCGAVKRTVPE